MLIKMRIYLLTFIFVLLLSFSPLIVSAQTEEIPTGETPTRGLPNQVSSVPQGGIKEKASNRLCIKVGTPTAEKPADCVAPGAVTTVGTAPGETHPSRAAPNVTPIEAPFVSSENLAQTIRSEFGVNIEGAWDETHLRWIYEKFYELARTHSRFMELLSGEKIGIVGINDKEKSPNQLSGYVKMPLVGSWANYAPFMEVLIHELGHSIYHNKKDAGALSSKHDGIYNANGGASFSGYANLYGGITQMQENYAEVIAYCLTGSGVVPHAATKGLSYDEAAWAPYRSLGEEITGGACVR